MILRIVEAAIPAEDHETKPAEPPVGVFFTEAEHLFGQVFSGESNGELEPKKSGAFQEPFEMEVTQDQAVVLHPDRLEQAVPITEAPVVSIKDGCSGGEEYTVKINEWAQAAIT